MKYFHLKFYTKTLIQVKKIYTTNWTLITLTIMSYSNLWWLEKLIKNFLNMTVSYLSYHMDIC